MGVYITDMQDPVVNTSQECFDLIEYGNNMKTIAATAMNPQSSRGYTIIKFHTERKDKDSPTVRANRVLDLAKQKGLQTAYMPGACDGNKSKEEVYKRCASSYDCDLSAEGVRC